MALVLRYAIRSHVGLIREGNEDSGYAGPRLLAIADGMGGAAAGELASAVVMTTVSRLDSPGGEDLLSGTGEMPVMVPGGQPAGPGQGGPAGPGGPVPDNEQTLHISQHDMAARESGNPHSAPDPALGEPDLALLGGAVVAANERLRAIVAERPELEGMGTTLTAMLWSGGRFGMVHVGDSRAYRLREGLLEQMTADHTWVQRLIDEGRITEEEAGHHPQRSLLMRVLDGRTQVEADIGTFDAYPGDRYLLCSDGLSGFVSQETLAETLAAYADPQQAVDALIELALRAGGPDNITCIVADTLDDGALPGASPNEATQMLGSLTPVVVGAASEGVEQLPRFSTPASGGPGPGGPPQDDFPQNHPAGRAARLRSRRGQQNQQNQQMTAEHPGAPVATAPQQFDPSAQTTEMESVPGQRGLLPDNQHPGARRNGEGGFGGPEGMAGGPGGPAPAKRSKKGLLITGAVVVVLAAAAGGAYVYSQGQYYVTPSSDNKQVLLYQGLSQLSFASSQQSMSDGPLWISSVPQSKRADLFKTQSFGSKDAALAYLAQYRSAAKSCADYRHSQPAIQQAEQQGATGKPASNALPGQNLAPTAPATSSKNGAALANGPASESNPNAPTSVPTGTSAPTGGEQGTPEPQNPTSSPSAPASQQGDDPQMKAYCAGTTDGPQ